MSKPFDRRILAVLAVLVAVGVVLWVARDQGRAGPDPAADPGDPLAAETPPDPTMPGPVDLTTPESAVRSYLDWTTLAYATGVSDVASRAVEPYELVRVDSYIAYNRQNENKRIYQVLDSFEVGAVSEEGTHTLVTADETWRYRYFADDSRAWVGPAYDVSYEATYTLFAVPEGWIVAEVEATALGEVP